MKIAIDIGHNCYPDIGASGVGDENVMNMEVGQKVISKLQALKHTVISVLPSSCSGVGDSLAQRVNNANENNADLYVAIHFNCGGGHGTEVWCGSQSSADVATSILNKICDLGFTNRGVKMQGQNGYEHLYVLNNTSMPALLVEGCFVDSQDDMNLYNAENMADAIVEGITGQTVNSRGDDKMTKLKVTAEVPIYNLVPYGNFTAGEKISTYNKDDIFASIGAIPGYWIVRYGEMMVAVPSENTVYVN